MNDSTPTTIMMEDSSNNNITDDEVVTGKTRKGGGVKSIVSSLGMKSYHKDDDAGSCGSSDQGASLLLKFQNLALTGRRAEYSLIKASYKRIQKGKHPSEVVLISGLTGTGKSMLAESIREPVTLKRHGFYVSGKYTLQSHEPYSALVEIFSDLCDLIAQDADTCREIATKLKSDISVLSKVIPNLSMIVGTLDQREQEHGTTTTASVSHRQSQASFTQLKLACRKFLKTVASRKHPVVLLVDDLQWADAASMAILCSIITDLKSKYVLLIGTYRSNDAHLVEELLDIVEGKNTEQKCLRSTSIHLNNFTPDQVTLLLARCMDMSKKSYELRDLAGLVVKRTAGNPFYVVRFLEMLAYNNLFSYGSVEKKWQWSLEMIQEETIACDNVVAILQARIKSLRRDVQSVLRLAAILGFTFDKEVIKAATLRKSTQKDFSTVSRLVDSALDVAVDGGLIESNTDGTYKFCHDGVADCLYCMTPEGKKLASAHILLAHVMQDLDDKNDKPGFVFSIADQLNRSTLLIEVDSDCLNSAQCNLRAAKIALEQSAFGLASEYALHGLAIMKVSTKWDAANYTTVMDLHILAAEALYRCGHLEESNQNLEQVFQHAKSPADVSGARVIHIYALGANARLEEAIDVAFCAARELGAKLPKNPSMLNAVVRLIKTKSMLRGKTDEQLLSVPVTDNESMHLVNFLGIAAHYSSLCMSIPHLILSITTMMQLSAKGKCSMSSSFCLYGILLTSMGNIREAVRMAHLAGKMHEIQDGSHIIAGDTCIIHAFLIHWSAPLADSLQPLQHAYEICIESGVVDVAFLAVATWVQSATFSGYPLDRLEAYEREYFGQMYEFEHMSQIYLTLPYWQFCLNMLGQSDDPMVLTGEAMDETTYRADAANAKVLLAPPTLNLVQIMLAFHFDSTHMLQDLLTEFETYEKVPVGHFVQYFSRFFLALSYIKLYRSFWKGSDKRMARKYSNQVRKWTLNGCPNTKCLWALLQAELSTLARRPNRIHVGALYHDAIKEASSNLCVEAIANECAARYYQTQTTNEQLGRLCIQRAIELYRNYGAFAKVDFLERASGLSRGSSARDPSRPNEIVAN